MATVTIATRTRKNGKRYIVQYKDPETGKKKYHSSFRRKDMAQQEANKLRTILDDGSLPASKQKSKTNRGKTFREVAELCRQDWLRRQQEGDLSSTTVAGYNTFLKPLEKQWGRKLIAAITFDEILEYRAALAERKSQILSNRRLFILKQIFAKAKILGAIRDDEIVGIKYLSEKAMNGNRSCIHARLTGYLKKQPPQEQSTTSP
nr:hypothetical protein [Pseudodesulfovibrio sp.]